MLKTKMNERQKRIIVDTAGISLTLIASVVYLFIGVVWGLWHPYWIIIACVLGLSAAAKIVVEANIKINKIKLEEELKRIKEAEEKEANKLKLLNAPKQIKPKTTTIRARTVTVTKPSTINVEEMIENRKAEIRKRTLGVDIKETKTSSIKEQTLKISKPKTTKIIATKEVKAKPIKKASATKTTTTKTPTTKTLTKKVSTATKTITKQATKAPAKKTNTTKTTTKTSKTTAIKKAGSSAKKVVKK